MTTNFRSPSILLLAITIGFATSAAARAAEPASEAPPPDPVTLLREASAKLKAIDWLEYDFEYTGAFAMGGRVRGHAVVAPAPSFADLGFRADVVVDDPLMGMATAPRRATVALSGGKAYQLDPTAKRLEVGTVRQGGAVLLRAMNSFILPMFRRAEPFGVEIDQPEVHRWVGRSEVEGVLCDVVYLRFPADSGLGEQYFYLGVEDRLPRRLLFVSSRGGTPVMFEVVASGLRFGEGAVPVALAPEAPPGWSVGDLDAIRAAVGDPAPSWELETPQAERVSSADVGGDVVVLDFWATWCPFCQANVPFVEKLTADMRDAPVRVFAVQIWDDTDPVAFLEEQGHQLDVLVDGDELARQMAVAGTPTAVVVGRDGRILLRTSASGEARDAQLRQAIEEALSGAGSGAAGSAAGGDS